jgi:Transposase DNA-binding/Transposase Tn5 dimerisation domain
MSSWVEDEMRYINLGDQRRNRRLIQMVEDLSAQPSVSVPQASRDLAALQGLYDFWQSPRVNADAIIAAHRHSTVDRMAQTNVVLAIQDTTEFNFTTHPKLQGAGYLDHSKTTGVKCHSVFAVSAEGVPLGVLHQHLWARDPAELGKKHQRHQRPTADKESQRWLDGLLHTQALMPNTVHWVMVGDREADIYDLLALGQQKSAQMLVRAAQNRLVQASEQEDLTRLMTTLAATPVAGTTQLDLKRHPDRAARTATLTLRFTTLEIQPPQSRSKQGDLPPVRVQVILAQELNPPPGEEDPVSWLLLTTLPVKTLDDALQCLQWYTYRWLIERYHFVLKSGCRIEKLQLRTTQRIERALATYAIVAWRLLWLTYEARRQPDQPADRAFSPDEWQALYATIHQTPVIPDSVPTLSQCVRWIAQLGGFIGRKRDGEPGVQTLWLGLRRLHDIVSTWKLLKQ